MPAQRFDPPFSGAYFGDPPEFRKEEQMALLSELYVALRTRNTSDAETDDSPVLVIQRNAHTLWSQKLFGDYLEDRGAGAVFRFDIADAQIDSADLDLQLWASGDDAWSPEHVIAWGVTGA